jgi:hypothetical protein
MKDKNSSDLSEREFSYDVEKEFTFKQKELFVKEISSKKYIGKIKLKIVFEGEIIYPKIVSKIDVLTRGRFIEYEVVQTKAGRKVKFSIVSTFPNQNP